MANEHATREKPQQDKPSSFAAAHLAALIESTRDLIWSVDLDYRLVSFNKALCGAFARGYGVKIAAGMTPRDLLSPEKAAFFPPLYEKALCEGPCSAQYRLADGRCLEMTFNPILQDGRKVGVSVFGKDVTRQNSAEDALLRTAMQYRELFEYAPEAIFRNTREGKSLAINPAGARLLGYDSPGEAIAVLNDWGRQVWSDPAERAAFIEVVEQQGEASSGPRQFRRRDGTLLWAIMTARKICGPDGKTLYYQGFLEDITERKEALDALCASEARLKEAERLAMFGNSTWDADADTTIWSEGLYRITGRDPSTPPPNHAERKKLYTPESFAHLDAAVRHALDTGDPYDLELQIVRADGALRWTRARGEAVRDESCRVRKLVDTLQDITDQKLFEEKLRNSEENYRATFEQAAVGIIHTSFEGAILRCNSRFAEIVGYPKEEIPGMTIGQITAPEDMAASQSYLQQITVGQAGSAVWEKRYVRKDRSYTWVRITVSFQHDTEGRPIHLIAVVEDINARKAAEQRLASAQEALQVSDERYRTIFQSSLVMTAVTQVEDGVIVDANNTFLDTMGFESAEVIGHTTFELNFWTDLRDRDRFVELLQQRAEFRNFETWLRKKSGAVIPVLLSASVIQIGGVACALSVMRDVSEMRAAEEALRKTERRFREIFETAPEGIFQTTKEGRSLALNPAGAKMLGFPSSDDAVASITDSAHDVWLNPEDRARYVQLLEDKSEVRDFPCQFKRTDGTPIWVSLTARRVCGQDGETLYYQGFMEDITERKALEVDLSARVRELNVLSEMDSALLHARTEEELLTEYCRILVELGGYRMAFVGFAEEGPEKRILPVAHYGHEDGYLKLLNATWSDTERGRGPVGSCIRTGEVAVVKDFAADPATAPWHEEAAKRGYKSCISIPFRQSASEMACLTAYGTRVSRWSDPERKLMDQVASALGFGITTLRTEIAKDRFQEDLRASLEQTILVVAGTIEQRDPYTAGHQRRVADLCGHIAKAMGLSADRTHGLQLAANIHDLGKIGIPSELLAKPGHLSKSEFSLMRDHAEMGYEIIKKVHFPWPIAVMVRQHHERLDGSGYPQGLKAEDILLESKILAVADVVEAMITHRPYRVALGMDAALDEVLALRGLKYDPAVVDACVNLFRQEDYQFPA